MTCDQRLVTYVALCTRASADAFWQQVKAATLCMDVDASEMCFDSYPVIASMNKLFKDDFITLVETLVLNTSLVRTDTLSLIDALALNTNKKLADTISFTENVILTILAIRNFAEVVTLTDHGLLLNQNYFDHTGVPDGYFADDYFGDKRTW